MTTRKNGFSDMFWYIVIGLFVLLAIIAVAIWVPDNRMPSRKWGDFVFFTLLLFVCLAKLYWKYRGRSKFWYVQAACLGAHLAVYLPWLWRIDSLHEVYFGALSCRRRHGSRFLLRSELQN